MISQSSDVHREVLGGQDVNGVTHGPDLYEGPVHLQGGVHHVGEEACGAGPHLEAGRAHHLGLDATRIADGLHQAVGGEPVRQVVAAEAEGGYLPGGDLRHASTQLYC